METFKVGDKKVFNTKDSTLVSKNGSEVFIVKVYDTPDENHDEECLPMYDVVTPTNNKFETFHDELSN